MNAHDISKRQRRISGLCSILVAVGVLAAALAAMGSFTTKPVVEYCPQIFLVAEFTGITCGGVTSCPGPNPVPRRPSIPPFRPLDFVPLGFLPELTLPEMEAPAEDFGGIWNYGEDF